MPTFFALIRYLQIFTAFWPREQDTLRLLFIGDVMQHEAQLHSALLDRSDPNNPNSYSYSSYFTHLQEYFKRADIVAANIETTFSSPPFRGYPAFNSPSSLATECVNSGINLLLAANNHILDSGVEGLGSTISLYKNLKVPYIGVYRDSIDAQKNHPLIIEERGVRVAFLNYTYGTNGIKVPPGYVVNLLDSNLVKKDLATAASLEPHIVVAALHWGEEYHLMPSQEQKRWEALFYRYGTDIIVGSHPHVPQPVVLYRDRDNRVERITAYSLGNAISNMSAQNCRVGIMLELLLLKDRLNGRVTIGEPEATLIWSVRGNQNREFTILPLKRAVEKGEERGRRVEEFHLMKRYYNKFNNVIIDERAHN